MNVLELFDEIPHDSPLASLADIWHSLAAVLRHYKAINNDDAAVQAIQHDMLRDCAILSPSIYGAGADLCTSSFYIPHIFAFLFEREEGDYLWLTTQLDRCFGFGVLHLPKRDVTIALYPFSVSEHIVGRLEGAMAGAPRTKSEICPPYAPPLVVTGFFHFMHVLWNELPAIDRALASGRLAGSIVAHVHQPLGPLDEIFPELRERLRWAPAEDDAALNGSARMLIGLGTRTIPASTQARLRGAALSLARPHLRAETAGFRSDYWPIFWVSVKPPNRSVLRQDEILSDLVHALKAAYPQAGFLINGVGIPWDLANESELRRLVP